METFELHDGASNLLVFTGDKWSQSYHWIGVNMRIYLLLCKWRMLIEKSIVKTGFDSDILMDDCLFNPTFHTSGVYQDQSWELGLYLVIFSGNIRKIKELFNEITEPNTNGRAEEFISSFLPYLPSKIVKLYVKMCGISEIGEHLNIWQEELFILMVKNCQKYPDYYTFHSLFIYLYNCKRISILAILINDKSIFKAPKDDYETLQAWSEVVYYLAEELCKSKKLPDDEKIIGRLKKSIHKDDMWQD